MVIMLESERFVICMKNGNTVYKISNLFFGKNGDIYIKPSYYQKCNGIIIKSILPCNMAKDEIELNSEDKFETKKIVKIALHPQTDTLTAASHFSENNINSNISRINISNFEELIGHISTIQFEGYHDFEVAQYSSEMDSINRKKQYLFFNLDSIKEKMNCRILIYRYLKKSLHDESLNSSLTQDNQGNLIFSYLISAPSSYKFSDYYIILQVRFLPLLLNNNISCLIYYCGFDKNKIIRDSQNIKYIMAYYPKEFFPNLEKITKSIDTDTR